ncbi:MAG: DUF4250 domain-containing protein [Akkermansiaceae bacterium]
MAATFPTLRGGSLREKGGAVNAISGDLPSLLSSALVIFHGMLYSSHMNLTNFAIMDPHLLAGLVNTELRNKADSLEDLCKTHGLNQERLVARLAEADYFYQEDQMQFR